MQRVQFIKSIIEYQLGFILFINIFIQENPRSTFRVGSYVPTAAE